MKTNVCLSFENEDGSYAHTFPVDLENDTYHEILVNVERLMLVLGYEFNGRLGVAEHAKQTPNISGPVSTGVVVFPSFTPPPDKKEPHDDE